MRCYIVVTNDLGVWTGLPEEMTQKEQQDTLALFAKADQLNYLSITTAHGKVVFPHEVISRSVLMLYHDDDTTEGQ